MDDRELRDKVVRLEAKQENLIEDMKTLRGWVLGAVGLVLVSIGKQLLALISLGGS